MADGRPVVRILLVGVASACAALAPSPSATAAQSFTGRVTDETSGRAVPTAAVHLVDREGRAVRSTLAGAAGRYTLAIPEAGEYRLVVERFGYAPTESPLFAVTADRDYPVDLSMRPEPVGVEGVGVTVRNERVEDWLTGALNVSPWSIPGFRHIQGRRLREAIAKSDDGIDMARWLYLPAFNQGSRFCIGAYTGGGCLHLYVDGQYLPSEHLELVDVERVVSVLVVPPNLHLLTRGFDFAPFAPFPFAGMEYGQPRDTLR